MNKSSKHNCKFCSKEFETGFKLGGHSARCKMNPNYKKTSLKDGLSKKGKHLSKETKEKISISRIKYLKEHPDKVPYRLNHSSKKSWIEKTFEEYLIKNEIVGWIYNYDFSVYRLDFAFPEWKLDVELDGSTHQNEKVKIIDERRNRYLKNQGWKVVRFTAKEIRENIYTCIQKLCDELKNEKIIQIPIEFLNKKGEKLKRKKEQQSKKEKRVEESNKMHEHYKKQINDTILEYGNKHGIVQQISKKIKKSHSHIRRLANKYGIDLYNRALSSVG